ncbi:hypothetical protein ACLOJK_039998 [Asimina triloba]
MRFSEKSENIVGFCIAAQSQPFIKETYIKALVAGFGHEIKMDAGGNLKKSMGVFFPPSTLPSKLALLRVSLSLWKMEEGEAGMKTPDDESTAESAIAPPKIPESPPFLTEDLMDFELDEEALEELWQFLEEDIVAPDAPPASEAVKIDGVGNAKKSGTTSPETGTPLSTIVHADMDDGISVSDLLESTGEGTNAIPSGENRPSGTEMDHVLLPADQKTDSAAAAVVARNDDDEWRERVLGREDLNLLRMENFEF